MCAFTYVHIHRGLCIYFFIYLYTLKTRHLYPYLQFQSHITEVQIYYTFYTFNSFSNREKAGLLLIHLIAWSIPQSVTNFPCPSPSCHVGALLTLSQMPCSFCPGPPMHGHLPPPTQTPTPILGWPPQTPSLPCLGTNILCWPAVLVDVADMLLSLPTL